MLSHGFTPLHQLDAAEDGAAVLMHLPPLQQKTCTGPLGGGSGTGPP